MGPVITPANAAVAFNTERHDAIHNGRTTAAKTQYQNIHFRAQY